MPELTIRRRATTRRVNLRRGYARHVTSNFKPHTEKRSIAQNAVRSLAINEYLMRSTRPLNRDGRTDGSWVNIKRASPIEELGDKDFAAIQLIWHTFDYVPLFVFPDTRDVREIYDSLLSREMFHEWVVYTIIFQSHLLWHYEMIVQMPGLVKADFLRLCQKYRITLQDSAAFAEDMNELGK